MPHATFACNQRARRIPQPFLKTLSILLLTSVSHSSFCIDLVSTNSAGMQGPVTAGLRASEISNDGNTVLFLAGDPTLVPGFSYNFYVKTLSTGVILPVVKRLDNLPLQAGDYFYAHMDEPPTRVVFSTREPNLIPGTGDPFNNRLRIFTAAIGSYQYTPARGIATDPEVLPSEFAANSRLDRIYMRTSVAGGGPESTQIVEVSATLPTPLIVHTVRPDGLPSQVPGSDPFPDIYPSISASADGKILAWWGTQFDIDPVGNDGLATGQVFVRNTQIGVTRQLRADDGSNLHFALFPRVSDSGNYVVFNADSYFVADGNCSGYSIYGVDTISWQRECISVNDSGQAANGISRSMDVSADGSRVVFESRARNLGPTDPSPLLEYGVYVRDRRLKRTVRVDVNALGVPANVRPFNIMFPPPPELLYPRISKNGRWVVFTSNASNLVPNDTNGHQKDIYRVDLNQFFGSPLAAPVPVPGLSLWGSLLLILGVLGAGRLARQN